MLQMGTREQIRSIRAFNAGAKNYRALRFFGKPWNELTGDEQLDIEDMVKEDNE